MSSIFASSRRVAHESRATFLHVNVSTVLWLDPSKVLTALSALNPGMNRAAFLSIPREPGLMNHHTSDHTAAFAQETVLNGHYSSPQHNKHRPLTCLGLHLSLLGPHTRADGGATHSNPCFFFSILACFINDWRTN
jgi:hypothetical protein